VGFFILGDIIMNKGRLALRGRARTRVARKEGSGKNGETYVVQEVSNRPELESTAVVSLALHSYRVKEERQRNTGKRSSSTSGSESAGRRPSKAASTQGRRAYGVGIVAPIRAHEQALAQASGSVRNVARW
jgi:hypothetical protein